ncbi:MAG: hypothetical protein WAT91_11495, partial [Saprospiraceae bacterium]
MNSSVYKIIILSVLILLADLCLRAQNLAPNPDFEFHTNCPSGFIPPNTHLACVPWDWATWGTTDYFNSCAMAGDEVDVPDNAIGFQYAHSGEGYCGFILRASNPLDYREYLLAPLNSALIGGKYYYVSFYVSLANERCAIQKIGAYFSPTPPPITFGDALPLPFTPQVETGNTFLNDTVNWMLIEGCFKAAGGEAYVTIGNFHTNADTPLDPTCNIASGSYYYIDDVYISDITPGGIDVELGSDLSACYTQDINSGITGVEYYWSTGSTDPSITVTTSGMYYLTVYDGCEAGIDSVYVTITNSPPVDLVPDQLTVCLGESFSFSLDPDDGEYVWSDGSTSSDYTISSSGIYSVTLDDGCDITSDDINFTVLEPPAPFDLPDTTLCEGEEIEIFFDPDLGDFLWQNNSTSNSFIIVNEGSYAVTITNMCGEASSDFEVVEVAPVFVNLGPNADTLCNGQSLNFNLDPALGSYIWQDGSTSPSYQITNSGLYSVSMTNICGQSVDSVTVLTSDIPVFSLGDTLSACPGDTIMLVVPGTIGEYTWQDGSVDDTLSVTSQNVYALTIENVCGS